MLTLLWLAHRDGYTALAYVDDAAGELGKDADGGRSLHRTVLRPRIVWRDPGPDAAALDELHHRAHGECFIARSLKRPVVAAS